MASICPCISLSQTAGRIRWGIGYRGLMGMYCLLFFLAWMCAPRLTHFSVKSYFSISTIPIWTWIGMTWIIGWHIRGSLRQKFKITEKKQNGGCGPSSVISASCKDFFINTFCHPCSLAQMARHLNRYSKRCEHTECNLGPPLGLP